MRSALFVLALVAAAAPASAQLDSKQAAAQLKPAAKTRLADAKAQFADLQDATMDAIAEYELGVDESGYDPAGAIALFDTLNAWIGQLSAAEFDACKGLADDASELLAQITDAEVVAGTPPEAFAAGLGSTYDDTRDKLVSAAEKSQSAVFKRLNKTVKKLGKLDVNMVVVRRPLPLSNLAFAPDAAGTHGTSFPVNVTLDLALSFSRSDTDDDGLICIAGQAHEAFGDVGVGAGNEESTATPEADRWSFVFGSVTGMPEGNTFVTVSSAGFTQQDSTSIAVR